MKPSLRRSGLWIIVYLVLFLLAQYGAYSFLVYDTIQRRACSPQKAASIVLHTQQPLFYALAVLIGLLVFYLLIWLRRIHWWDMILLKPVKSSRLLIYFFIGVLLNILFYLIMLTFNAIPQFAAWRQGAGGSGYSLFAAGVSAGELFSVILSLGILVPIYEEIVFRGFIFRELATAAPLHWAWLLQAVIFTLYHRQLLGIPLYFMLALVLGGSYIKEKSILTPCAVHCGFNITGYLIQAYAAGFLS